MGDRRDDVLEQLLAAATADPPPVDPPAGLREHVMEMARAPREPVDPSLYTWEELVPGVRIHVLEEDPARDFRVALVWADPGARVAAHRHLGDEEILVLQGSMRDERREYAPGDICRSRAGSVHSEEVTAAGECLCYVVYHGGHEVVEE